MCASCMVSIFRLVLYQNAFGKPAHVLTDQMDSTKVGVHSSVDLDSGSDGPVLLAGTSDG